eukprot:4937406-Alexandrium_andersonii.AAC.1
MVTSSSWARPARRSPGRERGLQDPAPQGRPPLVRPPEGAAHAGGARAGPPRRLLRAPEPPPRRAVP